MIYHINHVLFFSSCSAHNLEIHSPVYSYSKMAHVMHIEMVYYQGPLMLHMEGMAECKKQTLPTSFEVNGIFFSLSQNMREK